MSHRGLAALSFALAAACASGPGSAPERVGEFVGQVERVQVQAELGRVRVGEATAQLRALATTDHGDGVLAAYGRYVRAVDAAEAQAQAFADALAPMRSTGDELFAAWERDVAAIASDRLRERSQARLQMTRERYKAVVASAEPALLEFVRVNRALRDIALFLAHDLNATSLQAIKDDVHEVTGSAERLDAGLAASLQAARAYVDAASLPAAAAAEPSQPAAPPAPPPAPPEPPPAPPARGR